MRDIHVELLLGRTVHDVEGRAVGRIEELVADRHEDSCRVREVHLGPDALLERLAMSAARLPFLSALAHLARSYRVPWDRIDLSDPSHPRLTCRADELTPGPSRRRVRARAGGARRRRAGRAHTAALRRDGGTSSTR